MYDPKVTSEQIFRDMAAPKFEWDRPDYSRSHTHLLDNVQVKRVDNDYCMGILGIVLNAGATDCEGICLCMYTHMCACRVQDVAVHDKQGVSVPRSTGWPA